MDNVSENKKIEMKRLFFIARKADIPDNYMEALFNRYYKELPITYSEAKELYNVSYG